MEGKQDPSFLSGDEPAGTTRVAWRRGDEVLVMLFNDSAASPATVVVGVPAGHGLKRQDATGGIALTGQRLSAEADPLSCRWAVLAE